MSILRSNDFNIVNKSEIAGSVVIKIISYAGVLFIQGMLRNVR